jgi:hypothetical protein
LKEKIPFHKQRLSHDMTYLASVIDILEGKIKIKKKLVQLKK